MSINISYDEAIQRIAEKVGDNRKELRKTRYQRRTEFTDLYGIPFYAESYESDGQHYADIYISVSPDMIYFLRYQFKLQIQTTNATDFEVRLAGVNITDYLVEQQDGDWIDGTGIWPTDENADDKTDFYDILDVAQILYNSDDEETQSDADKLTATGFKLFRVVGDAPFKATLYLYMKISVMAR